MECSGPDVSLDAAGKEPTKLDVLAERIAAAQGGRVANHRPGSLVGASEPTGATPRHRQPPDRDGQLYPWHARGDAASGNTDRLAETAEAELRRLSRQLVQAHEHERKSISRELHDEIGQTLTALRLELKSVQDLRTAPEAEFNEHAEAAKRLAEQSMRAVKDMAPASGTPILLARAGTRGPFRRLRGRFPPGFRAGCRGRG